MLPSSATITSWFSKHAAALADLMALVSLVLFRLFETKWLWGAGFRTLSDDDYARALIALRFADAPRMDPSGTSWLPAPFWLQGMWLREIGSSWIHVGGFTLMSGALAAVVIYVSARGAGVSRLGAWMGSLVWLGLAGTWIVGAAPVPELWTASAAAGALLLLRSHKTSWHWFGAGMLLAATLSRYETWTIAVWFAIAHLAGRGKRRGISWAGPSLLAVAGPGLWLAWNGYAHGDAFHFHHRVTAFWQALHAQGGAGAMMTLLMYPEGLLRGAWIALGLLTVHAVISFSRREGGKPIESAWREWGWTLGGVVALLGGLMASQVQGGAPTHHPWRALLSAWAVLWIVGMEMTVGVVDRMSVVGDTGSAHAMGKMLTRLRRWWPFIVVTASLVGMFLVSVGVRTQALQEGTDRSEEERLGSWLSAHAAGQRVLLMPQDYGYFAVQVAAWGGGTRIELSGQIDPRRRHEAGVLEREETLRRWLDAHGRAWAILPEGVHLPGGCLGERRYRSKRWRVLLIDRSACTFR